MGAAKAPPPRAPNADAETYAEADAGAVPSADLPSSPPSSSAVSKSLTTSSSSFLPSSPAAAAPAPTGAGPGARPGAAAGAGFGLVVLPPAACRVVRLLRHESSRVAKPALRCVGNIVCAEDTQHDFTQTLVDMGVVPQLRRLMELSARDILKEACWTMSNVAAGSAAQIQVGSAPRSVRTREASLRAHLRPKTYLTSPHCVAPRPRRSLSLVHPLCRLCLTAAARRAPRTCAWTRPPTRACATRPAGSCSTASPAARRARSSRCVRGVKA